MALVFAVVFPGLEDAPISLDHFASVHRVHYQTASNLIAVWLCIRQMLIGKSAPPSANNGQKAGTVLDTEPVLNVWQFYPQSRYSSPNRHSHNRYSSVITKPDDEDYDDFTPVRPLHHWDGPSQQRKVFHHQPLVFLLTDRELPISRGSFSKNSSKSTNSSKM